MATSQISGVNYEVDGLVIVFFRVRGIKLGDDTWMIGGIPLDSDSMMPVINSCIDADIEAGNGDRIAMLLLAPRMAVTFYLEGRLTCQHLTKATEGPDHIDIPDVDIDGRSLTVRIVRDSDVYVATADAEGNVI